MKRTIYYLCLLLISCGGGKADNKRYAAYPRFETIVDTFYEKYYLPYESKDGIITYYRFAKTKRGYEVIELAYENETEVEKKPNLFWSLETKKFLPLENKFNKSNNLNGGGESEPMMQKARNSYFFNRNIYYGYKGFEDDIINELEGASDLTDTLYESLSRAYGSKAGKVTGREYTLNKDDQAKPDPDKFYEYIIKEYENNKKILEHNPSYQTFVGRIDVKLNDQLVYGWKTLKDWGQKDKANDIFNRINYGPFMTCYAKNMLSACKKKAILFTNGDNDTFPLWYIQAKENYRTDVAVIDLSLLSLPFYIKETFETFGLNHLLTKKDYESKMTDIIYFSSSPEDGQKEQTDVREWLSDNGGKVDALPLMKGMSYDNKVAQIPVVAFKLNVTSKNYPEYANFENSAIEFRKNHYMYKNELAELDIIASNINVRPVFFTSESGMGWEQKITDNFLKTGLAVELVPYKEKDPKSYSSIQLRPDDQYDWLVNKNEYKQWDKNDFECEFIYANYIYRFYDVFSSLVLTNEDKATKLFKKMEQYFPLEKTERYNFTVGFASLFERMKGSLKDKAEEMYFLALEQMDKALRKDKSEKSSISSALLQIINYAQQNNNKKMLEKCNKFQAKLNESEIK